MALESFYGGKQGISPVIKANFSSKEALTEAFNNSSYEDVWFSELALIDTPNKFDKDNGKLYRRTLKTTLSSSDENYAGEHAEYIGQIVGPAGGIPNLEIASESAIKNAISTTTADDAQILFPTETGVSTNASEYNNLYYNNSSDIELLPGKDNNNYNDNIHYTWANIQTPDGENNTAYVYLGFKVPYSVFDLSVETTNYTNSASIERVSKNIEGEEASGETVHPFYWKWNITIPGGIRGIWQEIHIGNKTPWIFDSNNLLYANINDLIYDENTDSYSIAANAFIKNTVTEDHFWYITVKCPAQNGSISTYNFYLEPYVTPKEIEYYDNTITGVASAGDIKLIFDDNNSVKTIGQYQQIKNAEYHAEDGSIYLTYAGTRPNVTPVEGVKNSGNDKYYLMDSSENPLYINYIEDVYGDPVYNEFYVLYNSSEYRPSSTITPDENGKIQWNGHTWKQNANGVENGKYWLYLSPVKEVTRGLRVLAEAEEFNLTSSNAYFTEGLTETEIVDKLNTNTWTTTGKSPMTNPYLNGQDGKGGLISGQVLLAQGDSDVIDTSTGEYIRENYAFYYDALVGRWKSLGAWGEAAENTALGIYTSNGLQNDSQRAIGFVINTISAAVTPDIPWSTFFDTVAISQ